MIIIILKLLKKLICENNFNDKYIINCINTINNIKNLKNFINICI